MFAFSTLLSTPVINTQKVDTVKVDEYISKPLIPETKVTIEPKVKENRVKASNLDNCVEYAKSMTGISRTMGVGGRQAIQGTEPQVGAIGSLIGPAHAVVVEKVDGELVTFTESNFTKGFITRRTLPLSSFIGFIYN